MTIRHPDSGDLPRLARLWQQAFGDSDVLISGFFHSGFSSKRCMLAEENGQLTAALYWFDCLWQEKKIAYLYAIATDENHRGRGICKALMTRTHDHLAETGYAGAVLVPADRALARMYEKMGYAVCCNVASPAAQLPADAQEISPETYLRLRASYLPEGALQHTEPALSYLALFAKFYRFDGGICCGGTEEGSLKLYERLPVQPEDLPGPAVCMYLPFQSEALLPTYFALPMG